MIANPNINMNNDIIMYTCNFFRPTQLEQGGIEVLVRFYIMSHAWASHVC